MKYFLNIINEIGFVKKTQHNLSFYEYGEWNIYIRFDNQSFNLINLAGYDEHQPDIYRKSISHTNISINDYIILKKYFKSEWRELKFKELGLY